MPSWTWPGVFFFVESSANGPTGLRNVIDTYREVRIALKRASHLLPDQTPASVAA